MKTLIYLFSLLAPGRLRAAWREEWLAELHAARRAGGGRVLRLALGAAFDALSSRWTTRAAPAPRGNGPWRTDLKQTVRSLVRSPGHVTVVALCLGVGIAVSTTTFSILNALHQRGATRCRRTRADCTAASQRRQFLARRLRDHP